jgi:hypothetical protein
MKSSKFLNIFFIISGLGALWLSVMYWVMMDFPISQEPQVYYYLFNSLLLITIAITFVKKNRKYFSLVSMLLFISVVISIFIPGPNGVSLFMHTLGVGMIPMFGGPVLVPAFLISVIISFKLALPFYSRGKND